MKSNRQLLSLALALFLCQSTFAWQAPGSGPIGTIPAPERAFTGTVKKDPDLLAAPFFPRQNWFKRHFAEPMPKVDVRGVSKFEDFVIDGKLELSLRNYLQLVLANNVDIDVQRLNVEITRNSITRAYAPFDPFFLGSFNSTRTKSQTTSSLEGATTLNQLVQPMNFSYTQTLDSGLQYTAGFNANKTSTNNSFNFFNPALNAQMSGSFVMPLLRNRGREVNRLPIVIARSQLKISKENFLNALLTLISNSENAYWDLLGGRETLRVQEKALELSAEALKRSKKELELGAISPLDIYQPEANYATAEIQVTQARYRLQQFEDALRRQMGADLDPKFRNMPIVLTESPLPPADDKEMDREAYVSKALRMRPDIHAIEENVAQDDLSLRQATNALRPDLSLRGSYTSTGRGGDFYTRANNNLTVVRGGFPDALDQVFGFNFPIYQFGLNLRLPIRDRAAAANYADAVISKRQDTLMRRSLQQTVRQQVLNAVSQVESSKASVKLAAVARDLAQKQLDAEQKKYDLGTSVIFFVLDAQTRLVNAEAQLVNNIIQFRRNLITVLRVSGDLLEDRGIQVQ
ncbi:MAG: TolC family protein [Acidobacteria bacterium]|nr:TolC family protein [Acidobacteriota bacterium]